MAGLNRAVTTVSTKGQVILPKTIREATGWLAGQRLVVEQTPEGVLLRPASPFPLTRPEDVFGCLKPRKSMTDREIEQGLKAAAKRRYARG